MGFATDDASRRSAEGRRAGWVGSRPPLSRLALFVSAYIVAGGLGQGLALIPGVTIAFWPPAGIFLATLLLTPRRRWTWYVLAGCLAELTCNAVWFHNSLPFALLYYAANALEAITAAWLIRRFIARPLRFESLAEVAVFVVLGAGVAPTIGATVIALVDMIRGKHAFSTAWPLVWLGDSSGLLVSTPLTLFVAQAWRGRGRIPRLLAVEAVALAFLLVIVGALAFRGYLPTVYMTLPLVLWATVRFQLRGAASALGLVTLTTACFTILGEGEFAGHPESLREHLVMLQTFLGVTAVSALVVAALSHEHQRALLDLRKANSRLETRVAARTADLRASEATLRGFYENSPLMMGVVELDDGDDSDIHHIYDNPATERFFGHSTGGSAGQSARALGMPAAAIAIWVGHYRASQRSGQAVRFEYEHDTPSGRAWLSAVVNCLGPAEVPGRARFAYSVEDVTFRKRAEEAIRFSEERFRRAADATGAIVYETDLASDSGARAYGLERFIGAQGSDRELSSSWWHERIHPDDLPAHLAHLEASLADTRCSTYQASYRARDGDGAWRHVEDTGQILRTADGRATSLVGTIRDVTDRTRAQEALEEADRRKDEFLAMLAHELRNPLSAIRSAVMVLRSRGGSESDLQWGREVIDRQTAQLARLIDDLLDVSRITRGKIQLRRQALDVREVVNRAVEVVGPMIAAKRHVLSLSLPEFPLHVHADPARLEQVVGNLLTNAAKYTDEGGNISVVADREGDVCLIRVRDDGVGIAAEQLTRIFGLFAQVDASLDRSQGGLGIGLTLARTLVAMHGGSVAAASDGPGAGSEFTVRLPLLAQVHETRDEAPGPGPRCREHPHGRSPRASSSSTTTRTRPTASRSFSGSTTSKRASSTMARRPWSWRADTRRRSCSWTLACPG